MRRTAHGTWAASLAIALGACGSGSEMADGLPDPVECNSCHGDANAAPPGSLGGAYAPTDVGVGAHQLHLRDSPIRAAVGCGDCHVVPATVDEPGHVDGPHATVTFSSLADGGGQLSAKWDRETATCAQVYCHGASLPGGPASTPGWTFAVEPDPSRPEACGGCHPIPGASGAHAAHFALTDLPAAAAYGDLRTRAEFASAQPGYAFGCGNCHPTDLSAHVDGLVQVELTGGPPGSLKARNGAGARIDGERRCSEVYCHSSGQDAPAFAATPPWEAAGPIGCDGCHRNPPRYESGGGGTATANSHLAYGLNGYSYGHFSWHNMMTTTPIEQNGMHGVHDAGSDGASPMTCQACHYATVDPAQTGPSGFYYLDTSGDYSLPDRPAPAPVGPAAFSCAASGCHTGLPGAPPAGTGRVLPGRHVNGARDVVFDPRTGPPASGLPARAALPSRAYWVADVRVSTTPDADGGYDEPTGSQVGRTLSLHLANATYDPVAKTCAGVACHMKAYEGTPKQAWGAAAQAADGSGCGNCHVGP